MARYRATIKGQRGQASRLGSTNHPPVVKLNGWECGVKVVARPTEGSVTRDTFDIYMTGGSNAGCGERRIGTVWETSGGPKFVPAEGGK